MRSTLAALRSFSPACSRRVRWTGTLPYAAVETFDYWAGLADKLEPGLAANDPLQSLAYHRVIVSNCDADH